MNTSTPYPVVSVCLVPQVTPSIRTLGMVVFGMIIAECLSVVLFYFSSTELVGLVIMVVRVWALWGSSKIIGAILVVFSIVAIVVSVVYFVTFTGTLKCGWAWSLF